jgi:hypothetical protein
MRKANVTGLLADLQLSRAFGTCTKTRGCEKSIFLSTYGGKATIITLSSLVYQLYKTWQLVALVVVIHLVEKRSLV